MRARRSRLLGFLALTAFGCAGEHVSSSDGAGQTSHGATRLADAGALVRPRSSTPSRMSTAAGALSVEIELVASDDVAPCSACFDATAVAQGGNPPYDYAWSDPTLQGKGPHRICVTRTTELSVRVSDTAEDDEFGGPSASAQAQRQIEPATCSAQRDAAIDTDAEAGTEPLDAAPPASDSGDATGPVCACSNTAPTSAEHFLDNPSFEGTTGAGQTPAGWSVCQGSPDLLPALDVGGIHPIAATDGSSYLGLPLGTSLSQRLREPMRAGQHYWLSWAGVESGSFASGAGEFDVWLGSAACESAQPAGSIVFRSTAASGGPFFHSCVEVVAEHDYEYITLAISGGSAFDTAYVAIDDLRIAAYDFATRFEWVTSRESGIGTCAHLPLDTPFP